MKLPPAKTYTELREYIRNIGWRAMNTFDTITAMTQQEEGCSKRQAEAAILSWWNMSDKYDIRMNCLGSVLLSEFKKSLRKHGREGW